MIPAPQGAGSCLPTLARGARPAAMCQDPYVTSQHPRMPAPGGSTLGPQEVCLHCSPGRWGLPHGEGGGSWSWGSAGPGAPVGHQPGHAGLQGTGQGVRGCPSPSGQQVAPEGTGSGRRPGSGYCPPTWCWALSLPYEDRGAGVSQRPRAEHLGINHATATTAHQAVSTSHEWSPELRLIKKILSRRPPFKALLARMA